LGLFIEEAKDNLSVLEKGLLSIEAAGAEADSDLVNEIFRAVHSIKGGAGFFGLEKLKDLSHGMESLLNGMRNREIVATPSLINILLSSADTLNEMILDPKGSNDFDIAEHLVVLKGALAGDPSKNQEEAPFTLAAPGCPQSFVLSRNELESLFEKREFLYLAFFQPSDFKERTFPELLLGMTQTGILVGGKEVEKKESVEEPFAVLFATVLDPEMIGLLLEIPLERIWSVVPRGKNFCVEPLGGKAEAVVPQAEGAPAVSASIPRKELGEATAIVKQPLAESTLRVNVKALDRLMNLAGELVLTRNQMAQNVTAWNKQSIENTAQRLNLVTSDLQEAIMSTRMQPIGNVFNKFNRVVRDLCHELGKEIDLIIEGDDVDLDKTIIEAIGDPLTHLIRNAVDHGVEMPKERRQAGKDSTGTIKLSAFHEAGQVIIEIADDGNGIDARKVKEKARSLGILDAYQLEGMSEKELVKLIFHPGFSLAQKVTDISGRGVGMDVVHTNLTKIGGVIDIDTQLGKGTTFRIKLPLTLAIIPSLLIGVEDERYAIPQVNLVELVRV
ncbi:MAG TPA: chemotaxis protein CheA, partial [Chroococcales cyanobacterium]